MSITFDNILFYSGMTLSDCKNILNDRGIVYEESTTDKRLKASNEKCEQYVLEFEKNERLKTIKIWPDYSGFMEMPEKYTLIADVQALNKWIERYIKITDDVEIDTNQLSYEGPQLAISCSFNRS